MAKIIQLKSNNNKIYPIIKNKMLKINIQNQSFNNIFRDLSIVKGDIDSTFEKITIQNNRIKIGNNVKKISITGSLFFTDVSNCYVFGFVTKNNINQAEFISDGTEYYKQISIPKLVINVNNNDYLTLRFQINKQTNGTLRSGYIIVEIIE